MSLRGYRWRQTVDIADWSALVAAERRYAYGVALALSRFHGGRS